MHILEELWSGNLDIFKGSKHNRQYAEALEYSNVCEDKLLAALSDNQKVLYDEYAQVQQTVSTITDCETFIAGFRIGALLMLDIFAPGEMKEI